MFKIKSLLILMFVILSISTDSLAEGKKCKEEGPFLWDCVKEIMFDLNDEKFTIKRSGAKKITELYESTNRGKIQPEILSKGIETVGSKEFIEFMQLAQKDKSIAIIDSRKPGWHARLRIAGSINMPFTDFDNQEDTEDNLEDLGAVKKGNKWDFTNAKTVVAYCNGYWCAQTPNMFRDKKFALLKMGYPANKLKYFRGGMQEWVSFGLSVVGDGAK